VGYTKNKIENIQNLTALDLTTKKFCTGQDGNDNVFFAEALADEVTKISTRDAEDSALEECFKHVCKVKVVFPGY